MNTASSEGTFQLPSEVLEIVELASRIVRKELMPLEQEFLLHPGHAFGIKETTNLQKVFGSDVVDHLTQISRDTGLWYLEESYRDHWGRALRTLQLYLHDLHADGDPLREHGRENQ